MKANRFSFVSPVSCLLSLLSFVSFPAAAADVKMNQTIALTNGWNAVYVRVGPEETADELFKDWPVQWVALYDPADYLTTKQFSGSSNTEGAALPGYRVWRKGDRTVSSFAYVPANSVLVAYATKAHTSVFCGTPAAPRTDWHDSSAQGMANLFGVSTYGTTKVADYFSGLDVGNVTFSRLVVGGTPDKPTVLPAALGNNAVLADGQVVVVNSTRTGDWSGVMKVSPANGLDFGTSYKMLQLEVRNDSATDRTFSMTVRGQKALNSRDTPPPAPILYWRDADAVVTNALWTNLCVSVSNNYDVSVSKRVTAGDAWRIQVAADRTLCASTNGPSYGAIAEFRDITPGTEVGPSRMVTYVPIKLTHRQNQEVVEREMRHGGVWPAGLWVAVADLDTVNYIGEEATYKGVKTPDVPSGGTMRVRLPLFADVDAQGEGEMWLLQRFTFGYTTNGQLRVYSGAYAEMDEPLVDVKRFSSPFLPTDLPQVKSGDGRFGQSASFAFTVGEKSAVNPMRHAQHPSHDGLLADYSGETPSGDDMANYASTVKPESFSIQNRVSFAWDDAGQAGWNPSETLTGKLTWEFDGLRHGEANQSGTIRAQGRFTMKYVTLGPVRVKRDSN